MNTNFDNTYTIICCLLLAISSACLWGANVIHLDTLERQGDKIERLCYELCKDLDKIPGFICTDSCVRDVH